MKAQNQDQAWRDSTEKALVGRFAGSRAKRAYNWFHTQRHDLVIKLMGEIPSRLNALRDLEKAMLDMDAPFFRQLAEFFEFLELKKPSNPIRAAYGVYLRKQERLIEQGKRTKPVTRSEVTNHLMEKFGITDRYVNTIINEFGVELPREKDGAEKRRRST